MFREPENIGDKAIKSAVYFRVGTVGQNEAGQRREIAKWLEGNRVNDAKPQPVEKFCPITIIDGQRHGEELIYRPGLICLDRSAKPPPISNTRSRKVGKL